MLLEQYARLLLVMHAVIGAATVAASTHLVVWMRRYLRGQYGRHRAVRRFALISLGLFAATFVVGNLAYPTYKIRVRVGYLQNPAAVTADLDARGEPMGPGTVEVALEETDRIARWFDVKEHWAAIGLSLAVACAMVLCSWHPSRHNRAIAPFAFGLAVAAAATAWLAAIIGLVTSSYRAVGGLG